MSHTRPRDVCCLPCCLVFPSTLKAKQCGAGQRAWLEARTAWPVAHVPTWDRDLCHEAVQRLRRHTGQHWAAPQSFLSGLAAEMPGQRAHCGHVGDLTRCTKSRCATNTGAAPCHQIINYRVRATEPPAHSTADGATNATCGCPLRSQICYNHIHIQWEVPWGNAVGPGQGWVGR